MAQSNYIQIQVPIENADLVFDSLVDICGMPLTETDAEGNTVVKDKETQARKGIINFVDNAVTEHLNRVALASAQDNKPELDIS